MPDTDYYRILGVSRTSGPDHIRKAARRRMQNLHPDRNRGEAGPFMAVREAYETLKDPARRAAYDRKHPDAGRQRFSSPAFRQEHKRARGPYNNASAGQSAAYSPSQALEYQVAVPAAQWTQAQAQNYMQTLLMVSSSGPVDRYASVLARTMHERPDLVSGIVSDAFAFTLRYPDKGSGWTLLSLAADHAPDQITPAHVRSMKAAMSQTGASGLKAQMARYLGELWQKCPHLRATVTGQGQAPGHSGP